MTTQKSKYEIELKIGSQFMFHTKKESTIKHDDTYNGNTPNITTNGFGVSWLLHISTLIQVLHKCVCEPIIGLIKYFLSAI